MYLPTPYSPEEFELQQRILRDRITVRKRRRQPFRKVAEKLSDLVHAQMRAENRAARAARREARKCDPRQGRLFDGGA